MTTSPVMTVTDELLAELDLSVRAVWHDDDAAVVAVDALTSELRRLRAENAELERQNGLLTTAVSDVWKLKEGKIKSACLSQAGDATNWQAEEISRLNVENAELAQSLAESRANDQAAMGWLTSLRWASGDRGERMLPELVTHIEGLAKDSGRLEYMIGEQAIVYEQNGTASPTVYSLSWPVEGYAQTQWHKSARDAIDTAMATK